MVAMPGREHLIRTRWSDPILDEGFTDVPNLFLNHTHELGLDAKDQAILVHLMSFLRNGTRAWPSLHTLAVLSEMPERTVRRRLHALQLMGLLAIENRPSTQEPNIYDLGPLVRKLRALRGPKRRGHSSVRSAQNGHSPPSKMATEEEVKNKKQVLRDLPPARGQEIKDLDEMNREYARRVHGL